MTATAGSVMTLVLLAGPVLRGAPCDSPRLARGEVPRPSVEAFGAGEVVLEVVVDGSGGVAEARVLRETPPFTAPLRASVRRRTFEPGSGGRVLVVGLFGPPAPTPGSRPASPDVAAPSPDVPFPTADAPAPYPPTATGDASVLIEAEVDAEGAVGWRGWCSPRAASTAAPWTRLAAAGSTGAQERSPRRFDRLPGLRLPAPGPRAGKAVRSSGRHGGRGFRASRPGRDSGIREADARWSSPAATGRGRAGCAGPAR